MNKDFRNMLLKEKCCLMLNQRLFSHDLNKTLFILHPNSHVKLKRRSNIVKTIRQDNYFYSVEPCLDFQSLIKEQKRLLK